MNRLSQRDSLCKFTLLVGREILCNFRLMQFKDTEQTERVGSSYTSPNNRFIIVLCKAQSTISKPGLYWDRRRCGDEHVWCCHVSPAVMESRFVIIEISRDTACQLIRLQTAAAAAPLRHRFVSRLSLQSGVVSSLCPTAAGGGDYWDDETGVGYLPWYRLIAWRPILCSAFIIGS